MDNATKARPKKPGLAKKMLIALGSGTIIGIILHRYSASIPFASFLVDGVFDTGGHIFISILKMLVVPIVFFSLVCGLCQLGDTKTFGRLAFKTIFLYLLTTAIAITIALTVAELLQVGVNGDNLPLHQVDLKKIPPLKDVILNIFPSNPAAAMASGNMLQIIVFSILLGLAISVSGRAGERISQFFKNMESVIMTLIAMVLKTAPYGVFCLVAALFAKMGYTLILQLLGYFAAVLSVLFIQLLLVYPLLLRILGGLNPLHFYRKMLSAMLFAFSTSSSNASIPVVMNSVENKLGVRSNVASFVIPLGATINMDGTAIMQGVATVFIANTYHIDIGLTGYLMVVLTATLASIGTAGVPSVGLITLAMVLQQVGLPVEGIALIIGVDRLLDMTRTAVNISGDATIACIVGKSEQAMDTEIYRQ